MACPAGQYFDPTTAMCEISVYAPTTCTSGFYLDQTTAMCEPKYVPTPTGGTVTTGCTSGFYPDPSTAMCEPKNVVTWQCTSGYYLDQTTATCEPKTFVNPSRCPSGYYLDPTTAICEKSQSVIYNPSPTPSPYPTTTSAQKTVFQCPNTGKWYCLNDQGVYCDATGRAIYSGKTCAQIRNDISYTQLVGTKQEMENVVCVGDFCVPQNAALIGAGIIGLGALLLIASRASR